MSSVLTPWYPATTKPMRTGLYLTRVYPHDNVVILKRWNGKLWHYIDGVVASQWCEWQGLAFDPNDKPLSKIDVVINFDVKGEIVHRENCQFYVRDGDTINYIVPVVSA